MRLASYKATEGDRGWVERAVAWRKKWHETLNGLYYDDPLAGPDGIELIILADKDTPVADVTAAIEQGRVRHDVVDHRVVICPKEWLS